MLSLGVAGSAYLAACIEGFVFVCALSDPMGRR